MDNFDNVCAYCGTTSNLQKHHIKYRSQGGSDDEDNLITLCYKHHRQVHMAPLFMVKVLNGLRTTNHWRWQKAYDYIVANREEAYAKEDYLHE